MTTSVAIKYPSLWLYTNASKDTCSLITEIFSLVFSIKQFHKNPQKQIF